MPGGGLLGTLFQSHSEVLVSVACDPSIGAPELRLRMKRTDLVYVLKVKVEVALAHLVPRVGAVADGISLEYRGLVLKDMKPLDAYSITDTSELSCALVPVPLERDLVPAAPRSSPCTPRLCCLSGRTGRIPSGRTSSGRNHLLCETQSSRAAISAENEPSVPPARRRGPPDVA